MGLFQDIFGKKPKVPDLKPVDVSAQQINAAEGNLGALPSASKLATAVDTFNQAELDRMYAIALPGYENTRSQIGKNIGSLVKGEIPSDIADMIGRSAAGRALYGGYGGSGMARNLTGRDLGLTSLSLMERGQSAAERWLSAATAPRFDITSMFLSAAQRIDYATQERDKQFEHDYLVAQIKAMPDPTTHGIWSVIHQVGMSFVNAYSGNIGGDTGDPSGAGESITSMYAQRPMGNSTRGISSSQQANMLREFNGYSGPMSQSSQQFDAGGGFGSQFAGFA